jgi:signal transduction histidine kinase
MPIRPRTGRLFWKLLLALWVSMLLSLGGVLLYLQITGQAMPRDQVPFPSFGGIPIAPIVSGALAVLVVGLGLAWYLSRPLHHLRWALHSLTEGNFNTRVAPLMGRRRDEIVDLADEFDRMAAQLQKLTEARQQLLHDVSHELRSPITRLQVAAGLLKQDPSQAATLIERVQRESERIDELLEELLTLYRLEAGAETPLTDTVDVIELLKSIAEDAEFEARSASRSVSVDAPGRFVAAVNGELIYRALENVVRNAVKYTMPGTTVEIVARANQATGELVVTVSDRGPGVPSDKLESMFEPFTRVEGSEATRGVGLGLAIARRAVTLHGGRIDATLRNGGGLTLTVKIPTRPHG